MMTSGLRPSITPAIMRDAQLTKHPSRAISRVALRTRFRCPVSLVNAPPRQILTVFSGAREWQRMLAAWRATSPRRHAPSQHITATSFDFCRSAYSSQRGQLFFAFSIRTISYSLFCSFISFPFPQQLLSFIGVSFLKWRFSLQALFFVLKYLVFHFLVFISGQFPQWL